MDVGHVIGDPGRRVSHSAWQADMRRLTKLWATRDPKGSAYFARKAKLKESECWICRKGA